MFYAISWFVVLGLLALWSLAAWAVHAVTAWTLSSAGVLVAGSGAGEALPLPEWLAPWVPPEIAAALASMVGALTPAVEMLLAWAPALASGLTVLVWVVWALGAFLLIVLGVVLSGLIAVWRRRSNGAAVPTPASAAAR